MQAGPYYQTLTIHNNAGPLGTAASLHASNASSTNGTLAAIPNVTLLEAPWVNGRGETDVAGGEPVRPYPEVVDDYALPLERPGLGIEASGALVDEALVDEALAASRPFVPSLQVPRLRGPAECVGRVGAGFLRQTKQEKSRARIPQQSNL